MLDSQEPVLRPTLPIFDAHHHLWDRPGNAFLIGDLLNEIRASGHNVVATAVVESGSFTVAGGGNAKARAEAAFAAASAEVSIARTSGAVHACAVIVGHVDLRGRNVARSINALKRSASGRLRAIRHCGTWDDDAGVRGGPALAPEGLYRDPAFQRGLSALEDAGLAFDAWAFQTQHDDLLSLLATFPDLRIVYNHCGGVLGVGPYAGRTKELHASWYQGMTALAEFPNLFLKLGGLGMSRSGFPFFGRDARPAGGELADAWRPWLEPAIALFGPARCMFESNFPVDRQSCSYRALWNAFKIVVADLPDTDQRRLFHNTAIDFYR